MLHSQQVCVRRIQTPAELAGLRSDWDWLAGDIPLRSFDWLTTWWEHYGLDDARAELFVLVAADPSGRLIGILPLYRRRGAGGTRSLELLGNREVCTDYVTLLAQERHTEIAHAMADWLCAHSDDNGESRSDGWDVLKLEGACENDASLKELIEYMNGRDCPVHRRTGERCWQLTLPPTWDEYLAKLSKSHRKQLRQLERRILESDATRLYWAASEQELARGLEILVQLHRRRRASLDERGCFDSEPYLAFLRDLSPKLLAAGKLRLGWLEVDGNPIAAEYQLIGARTVYAYQSGIDPDALQFEPGRLITMAAMKASVTAGYTMYDFLRGDEAYKAHWRSEPVKTNDYRIAAPHAAARLKHNVWRAGQHMKQVIKTGLALSGHERSR